jgi:CHAT domain-containing protein/tetratricopeptide (TPR) repeat protein
LEALATILIPNIRQGSFFELCPNARNLAIGNLDPLCSLLGKNMRKTKSASSGDDIRQLQDKLGKAKSSGDKDAEIDALLAIGEAAVEELHELASFHFKLAEKVIRGAKKVARLNEAIGGQGKAFRRNKRFTEAIDRYQAAEHAARDTHNKAAEVGWILRRASAHRASGELDKAKAIVEQAENLLRPRPTDEASFSQFLTRVNFSDKEEVAALAELEGQMGLNLVAQNDEQGAEDHYRSALCFAEMAKDWDAVNVWGTNVGNACTRRGKYSEAIECYDKALAAAMKQGLRSAVLNTARGLFDCMLKAYRHEEGGDRLRKLAAAQPNKHLKLELLREALLLFDQGICVQKAIKTAQQIESLLTEQVVRPEFLTQVKSVREKMQHFVSHRPAAPQDGPPALDIFLLEYMSRAEKSKEVDPALQAAHLVCDVRLAIAIAGKKQWKRLVGGDLLAHAGLDQRVVIDTLQMLIEKEHTDQALELLQLCKAPTFCVPTLVRLENGDNSAESTAYVNAVRELCNQVSVLAGPAKPDFIRAVNKVRCAGERMREAGEALRDVDPILLARMGGPVRREELIDALPYAGGVGIVDFVVGGEGTFGIVLMRDKSGVTAMPLIAPTFNVTHVIKLSELYAKAKLPKQLGGAHTEALMQMALILHDNFLCALARTLSQRGITQLILVPDLLTQSIPLHLSYACGKEINIPGIDTSDANFLCEVMPVEYAPCLQAVAASQVYVRPRTINRIAAFADPNGDLPGVRLAMEQFGSRSGNPASYHLVSGASATKAALAQALPDADVLMFGTHGVFTPGELEHTHLVLSGESWTMADMVGMSELQKRALFVLVACEAGAIAMTPDNRNAWGIPGALVAAGASAVLANLWPVEDVTSNYLLERFLFHLGHRGYRPAAALFRAVRDLRRMGREDALAYCRQNMELLKQNKAEPRVIVGARSILEWIEDNDDPRPFGHPFFWGATVIFGSGWHLPAGAVVIPPNMPDIAIENFLRLEEADALVMQWQPRKALELATHVVQCTDGVQRGRAYTTMALALLRSADLSSQQRVHQKAARLLKMAQRIALSEGDDDLLQRVQWVHAQMENYHVDQKNG